MVDHLAGTGRFQILSLDGGGIRGVFSAAVLAAVEEDNDVSILDHFDMIAGTSTGGIIAIALGLGVSPREIVDFYVHHGPKIFDRRMGFASLRQWICRKYSAHPLEEAVRQILGDQPFGISRCRLVIPSYNVGEQDVYIFRTPHASKLKRDYRVPAWQVAMATSAAPAYLPAFRQLDRLRLIDGGVWSNNPAMVAYVEAVAQLEVPRESISMLSIGTLVGSKNFGKSHDWGGLLRWAPRAADLIIQSSSQGVSNQARLLLGQDRYLRVDERVLERDLKLDGARSVDDFLGKARHYSRKYMPHITSMFLHHRAAEYVPFHAVGKDGLR